MRPVLLIVVGALVAAALGYIQISHQAAREVWRAETSQLNAHLQQAERLLNERTLALTAAEQDERERRERAAKLSDLEARILDAAAELARLESDRTVARRRADMAIDELKEQVTALSKIEIGMATLGERRRALERQVGAIQARLQKAEVGAAERQERSEALDRDIAELAIRRETLLASIELAERSAAKAALTKVMSESTAMAAAASTKTEPPSPAAIPAVAPAAVAESPDDEPRDRSRGLYQFGSLSAEPEMTSGGHGGGPASTKATSDETGEGAEAADWADDQYLLGLRLLSTAEQNSGTRELSDAVLAFKAVLGEWPIERDRKRWAIVRSDLGYALALLGKRKASADLLQQATAASRDALAEFERGTTPLLWAAAQHHLGVSLSGLAEVRRDPALQQASIEALEQAIEAFKNAGAEADARKAERRLRDAHAGLPAETRN